MVLNLQAGSSPVTVILFLFAFLVLPMFTPALGNNGRSSSGDFPYSSKYGTKTLLRELPAEALDLALLAAR